MLALMLLLLPVAATAGLALLGNARLQAFRRRAPRNPALTMKLSDGRTLAYATYGEEPAKADKVVFYLHGLMGSRLEFSGMRKEFDGRSVSFVTIDRPGYGLSTMQPGRTYLGFADDVLALADHLQVKRFYMTGWSSGGCYALACAAKIPSSRLAGVLTIASDPPWGSVPPQMRVSIQRVAFFGYTSLRSFLPAILGLLLRLLVAFGGAPKLQERIMEANRQTIRATVQEMIIERNPWDFKLEDIKIPVYIWHGTTDVMVPVASADYLAERIPGSTKRILEGKGHMIVSSHWAEMVNFLLDQPEKSKL